MIGKQKFLVGEKVWVIEHKFGVSDPIDKIVQTKICGCGLNNDGSIYYRTRTGEWYSDEIFTTKDGGIDYLIEKKNDKITKLLYQIKELNGSREPGILNCKIYYDKNKVVDLGYGHMIK